MWCNYANFIASLIVGIITNLANDHINTPFAYQISRRRNKILLSTDFTFYNLEARKTDWKDDCFQRTSFLLGIEFYLFLCFVNQVYLKLIRGVGARFYSPWFSDCNWYFLLRICVFFKDYYCKQASEDGC